MGSPHTQDIISYSTHSSPILETNANFCFCFLASSIFCCQERNRPRTMDCNNRTVVTPAAMIAAMIAVCILPRASTISFLASRCEARLEARGEECYLTSWYCRKRPLVFGETMHYIYIYCTINIILLILLLTINTTVRTTDSLLWFSGRFVLRGTHHEIRGTLLVLIYYTTTWHFTRTFILLIL